MKQRKFSTFPSIIAILFVVAVIAAALASVTGIAQARPDIQTEEETIPANTQGHPVAIYFFWGDGCPHCAAAEPFLAELRERYPNVEICAYEVWYDQGNQALLLRMAAAHGFEPSGVPTIFIGDRYWIGFADPLRQELEDAVAACSLAGCVDAGLGIIPGIPTPRPVLPPKPASTEPGTEVEATSTTSAANTSADVLELPLIGTIDLTAQSLAVSTLLIAFVDGFNPCSLWVLSMLLALSLHTSSRKKVFWVGLVFLSVTALVYMLFITGLFTFLSVVGFMRWSQIAVALVALFFAAVNIKDYFWYKQGISFTIADKHKPGLYRKMRHVLDAGHSTWTLIGATVVLALGVSLVEFSCTAGFPLMWTNLLLAQQATATTFVLLLLLYMLVYQLDELAIFLTAVSTLKVSRLEEKQGRMLKLAGGMLMLTLAIVMLLNPALMNDVSSSLWVFALAFVATGVVLLLHRKVLPYFGLHIGTETVAATRHPRARATKARKQPRRHRA